MLIKSMETILTCPGRNYLIVKITTEDGVTGYGDATLNGRELSVKEALDSHLSKYLVGMDAERITDIWELVYRGTYWRGGPVLMTALAGIDMALWDIKGKRYGAPLYQLLGGRCRDRLRAYFHVHGHTKEDLADRIRQRMEDGCTCFRYSFDTKDSRQEGLYFNQPHQDISLGRRIEVTEGNIGKPEVWDTEEYGHDLIRVTSSLRDTFGGSIGLIHDSHERFTPIQAAAAAKQLERFGLFFLEDPVEPVNVQGLELIRGHSVTPIAMGELYNSMKDCLIPIERNLIDYLRLDISHYGGITPSMKTAAVAENHGVKIAFHGPSDISPLAHAALAHVDFAIPNFGIQEWVDHNEELDQVFHTNVRYENGFITIRDTPGLGVEVDEDAAREYTYKPKFLPTLRDREGAVHNW
ncbi:D-galactonate dehydratase family protein [Enterocloster citroniae]|uniref:D-galactonate dehydratase family protein n=1 Tax=Enterocloster citroniae TaxID=358743 RepID=UPI00349E7620